MKTIIQLLPIIIFSFYLLSCANEESTEQVKVDSSDLNRVYDTTGLPIGLIEHLDELQASSYKDIIYLYVLNETLLVDNPDVDNDSVGLLIESIIENKTLDKDSVAGVLIKKKIHIFKQLNSLSDSLNSKGEPILIARSYNPTYSYDFTLRKNQTFDVFYHSSFMLMDLEYHISYGEYTQDQDTIQLSFISEKPDDLDSEYIVGSYLIPFNDTTNASRSFKVFYKE